MGDVLESFTAFRIFGSFKGSPVLGLAEEPRIKELGKGAVEIHYVKTGSTDTLQAFLRWLPVEVLKEKVSTPFRVTKKNIDNANPSRIKHIHELDPGELQTYIGDGKNAFCLRLDSNPTGKVGKAERLRFAGAAVFDQFALSPESNFAEGQSEPVWDRRWILTTTLSEIVIGDAKDEPKKSGSSIRFNLALPTPVPQVVIKANSLYALPFTATYPSFIKTPAAASPTPVEPLTFAMGSSKIGVVKHERQIKKTKLADKSLGHFGLTRMGGATKDFLSFRNSWLQDKDVYTKEVLGRLGKIKLPTDKFELVKPSRKSSGSHVASVRFYQGSVTRIVFRSAIETSGSRSHDGGDGDLAIGTRTLTPEFQFKNLDRPGPGLNTGSGRLYVELEVTYALASKDIWNIPDAIDDSSSVIVRLGFEDRIEKRTDPDDNARPDAKQHLARAIKGMQLARLNLRHINAPQPQSIFPDIEFTEASVRLALTARVPATFSANNDLVWSPLGATTGWSGANFRLTLWPQERFICGESLPNLHARLTPYSFGYAPGRRKATNEIDVEFQHDPAAENGLDDRFCQFRLAPVPRTRPDEVMFGRLSSLEFATHAKNNPLNDDKDAVDYSHFRFGFRKNLHDPSAPRDTYPTANAEIRLRFAIASVSPCGTDVPWDDRTGRARPILIPLDEDSIDGGKFLLDMRESFSQGEDRLLTAELLDIGDETAAAAGSYVVIAQEPFTVTKFRSTTLGNRGTQDSASVASYDSDTRMWQFKRVSSDYHYEFQSQVFGESMDKPRRLEIEDPPENPKEPNNVVAPALDDLRRRMVDFRLAPSTELWVNPSDVMRGFLNPEWAAHELWRQAGDYGRGAALKAVRGELLYGMPYGVDVSREVGNARGARVAEIEALTGRPPGKPRASNPDPVVARRWEDVSRAIVRRPERLEIWARDFDSKSPFAPARFSAGVSFALRETAVHKAALAGISDLNQVNEGKPRVRDYGLSGGALWPIESANLYEALTDRPGSNGGIIENIAIAPGGGDGDQKALFLNRKVAVISETRNGFVQRHKVEVIGRVGALWHRAKHVVVYDRTVNPSAQFTPEGGIGQRTRRPVLRKVSEYIEFLQPERFYPDAPDALASSSAFLHSVRFNSKIINVDSAWSEDVGDFGWQIPLWNRDAARKRPQVYPRPDVGFLVHCAGEEEDATTAQECVEPDNLYFFADFKEPGDNTDAWKARVMIDCTDLPAPQDKWQKRSRSVDELGATRQPSVSRMMRGHRRFTWRLAPPARKATLNSGRSATPIYAGLESVTFMRSIPVEGGEKSAALEKFRDAVDSLKPPAQRHELWTTDQTPPILAGLADKLKVFRETASEPGASEQDVIDAAKAVIGQTGQASPLLDAFAVGGPLHAFADAAQTTAGTVDGALGGVSQYLKDAPKRCEKLVADFAGSLSRKQLLIFAAVDEIESDAAKLVDSVSGEKVFDLKEVLRDEVKHALQAAMRDVSTDRLGIGNSLQGALAIVRDFESDVLGLEQTISARLDALRQSYDDGKPWSQQRIRAFLNKLEDEREGLRQDVRTAVEESQSRFATELGDLARRIGSVASEAVKQVGFETFLTALTDAQKRLDDLVTAAATTPGAFASLDQQLSDAQNIANDTFKALIQGLRTEIANAKAATTVARDSLATQRRELESEPKALTDVFSSVTQTLAPLIASVNNALQTAASIVAKARAQNVNTVADGVQAFIDAANVGLVAVLRLANETAKDAGFAACAAVRGALRTAVDELDALLRDGDLEETSRALETAAAAASQDIKDGVQVVCGKLAALGADLPNTREDLDNLTEAVGSTLDELIKTISDAAAIAQTTADQFTAAVNETLALAAKAADGGAAEVGKDLTSAIDNAARKIGAGVGYLAGVGAVVDKSVLAAEGFIRNTLVRDVFDKTEGVLVLVSETGAYLSKQLQKVESSLSADNVVDNILLPKLVDPAIGALFKGFEDSDLVSQHAHDLKVATSNIGDAVRAELKPAFDKLNDTTDPICKELVDACKLIGGLSSPTDYLQGLAKQLEDQAKAKAAELQELIANGAVQELRDIAESFGSDVRTISNELASSYAATTGFAEKVFETAGSLGEGGLAAAPSNILKLYAAVAGAPSLPNLDFARERIAYYYGRVGDVIDTTEVEAWFGRLGDQLKALGLSLPVSQLGERLVPTDLSKLDIGRVLKNAGGMKFDGLFKGYKLPAAATEAIKVTHAFDKKLFRAWVQVDVDLAIPERRSLFSIGPFQLDFVDSRLQAQVRLEASKDNDHVEQSGTASLLTNIEAVVAGQIMVSLQRVAVRYNRASGLDVEFDPKNIKLNPSFQFVQDTLGSIFPDELGGLKLIKENGIPIGVEHEFAMPPISVMAGTSGISNIQISNHFSLIAYPDFIISDRFSLSKPEMPFIFSIFIIGGTGYITVDTEYRPFDQQLMVSVEAAVGGSAALGFAAGPISGSVYIALSGALEYRKLMGRSGGGLTVSMLLLVAGNVDVCSIARVNIVLLLRMSYQESGDIDATGTLTVSIRISRFFTLKARGNAQYKLRDGKAQTSSSSSTNVEVSNEAEVKARKLLEARS